MNQTGERIKLRLLTEKDTDRIVKWRNNQRVRNNFIYQKLFTTEGHRHWVDTYIKSGEAVQFIIEEADTLRPVGSVYFRDINYEHQKAEYGIFIGEDDAIGKGYGTQAAKLAIQYAFEELKLHKIMLRVFADNQAAIESYKKAGFSKEGYLKEDVCINGKFRDMILMAIWKK